MPEFLTEAPKDMAALREEIDGIDEQIISLLAERHARVVKIGHIKGSGGKPVIDPGRESAKLRQAGEWAIKHQIPAFFAVLPMKIIMTVSSVAQGFNPSMASKEFHCASCNWNTAGVYSEQLKWRVCPSCSSPLFFPRTEKKKR